MKVGRRAISKQAILESLKHFYKIRKFKRFTLNEYNNWKHRACCAHTVIANFNGLWTKALKAAGIK